MTPPRRIGVTAIVRTSAFGLMAAAAVITGCRSPTQIEVDVSTDLTCSRVTETSFTPGLLVGIEGAPPATTSTKCEGGHLGAMVLVPSGDDNENVAFKIVTAFDGTPVTRCTADAGYVGKCIVARRALRYLPHTTLQVPVRMSFNCAGNDCGDPTMTCVEGACVSATISDPSACEGAGCGELTLVDGGLPPAIDATVPEDAAVDSTLPDARPDSATADSAPDSTIADAAPEDAGEDTSVPPFDAGVIDGQVPACDLGGLQPGAAWPMSHYCPSHRARSPLPGPPAGGPTSHWVYPLPAAAGLLSAPPAVAADGRLYVGTSANLIETIKPDGTSGGEQLLSVSGGYIQMAPVLAFDQTLRVLDNNNNYISMPLDGGTISVTPIGTTTVAGLTIVSGGTMYFGDPNGHLNALNNAGNVLLWSVAQVSNEGDYVAVDHLGRIFTGYFGVTAGVAGVSPADGGTVWSGPSAERVTDFAVAVDQTVRGSSYDWVYGYDPSKGDGDASVLFQVNLQQTNGIAVGDDGWTYVGAGSSASGGGLYALNPAGNPTRGSTTSTCGPPILDSAENVYAWCDGAIVAYSKHLAAPLWTFDLSQQIPDYPQMSVTDTVVIGQQGRIYFSGEATYADGGYVQLVVALIP